LFFLILFSLFLLFSSFILLFFLFSWLSSTNLIQKVV
jgi:hypothetical protein